jgi:flagellar hook-length control protein FliK
MAASAASDATHGTVEAGATFGNLLHQAQDALETTVPATELAKPETTEKEGAEVGETTSESTKAAPADPDASAMIAWVMSQLASAVPQQQPTAAGEGELDTATEIASAEGAEKSEKAEKTDEQSSIDRSTPVPNGAAQIAGLAVVNLPAAQSPPNSLPAEQTAKGRGQADFATRPPQPQEERVQALPPGFANGKAQGLKNPNAAANVPFAAVLEGATQPDEAALQPAVLNETPESVAGKPEMPAILNETTPAGETESFETLMQGAQPAPENGAQSLKTPTAKGLEKNGKLPASSAAVLSDGKAPSPLQVALKEGLTQGSGKQAGLDGGSAAEDAQAAKAKDGLLPEQSTSSPFSLPSGVTAEIQPGAAPVASTASEKTSFSPETGVSVANQVADEVASGVQSGRPAIHLQLKPEALGEVRIALTSAGAGAIHARLVVQEADTRQLLDEHIGNLREALEAKGLRLESAQVVLAGGASSGAHQQSNDSRQPGAQQEANPQGQQSFQQSSDSHSRQQQALGQLYQQLSQQQGGNSAFGRGQTGEMRNTAALPEAPAEAVAATEAREGQATNPAGGRYRTVNVLV